MTASATQALLVAAGASVGAPLRLITDTAVTAVTRRRAMARGRPPGVFPVGTLVVNVVACLLLGAVVGADAGSGSTALLGTGLAGTLSTYSTFGYEVVRLLRGGRGRTAVATVLVSLVAGPAAAAAGLLTGHAIR